MYIANVPFLQCPFYRCVIKDKQILQVDPTFNLGSFEVTLTTFKNTLLVDKHGAHPLCIGPSYLHTRKDRQAFDEFFLALAQYIPDLKKKSIHLGTDGEVALFSAAAAALNIDVHLRCSRHVAQSIRRIDGATVYHVNQILGFVSDAGLYHPGVADIETRHELKKKVQVIEAKWKTGADKKVSCT